MPDACDSDSPTFAGSKRAESWRILKELQNVWPSIFLGGVSLGLTLPVESYIVLNFFSQKYTEPTNYSNIHCETDPNASYCKSAVQDSVRWTGITSIVFSVVHILLGPALGVLSDTYGRRKVILVCVSLGLLPSIAQALFVFFNLSLYVWFGLLLFSYMPVLGVWFALVTDLIKVPSTRAVAFGFVLIGWEMSMLIGMLCGAFMSLATVLLVALVLDVLDVCYIYFALKESFPAELRQKLQISKLVPLLGLSILRRNSKLVRLTVVFFMTSFIGMGIEKIGTSYLQKYLDWTKNDNYVGAIVSQLSILLWMACALQPITRCAGEIGLLCVGQIAAVIYELGLYLSSSPSEVWILRGITSGAMALAFPATAALKGAMVEEDEQGHIQGALQTVKSVAACMGPVAFAGMFNAFATSEEITTVSGAFFVIGALLDLGLLPVILSLPRDVRKAELDGKPEMEARHLATTEMPVSFSGFK